MSLYLNSCIYKIKYYKMQFSENSFVSFWLLVFTESVRNSQICFFYRFLGGLKPLGEIMVCLGQSSCATLCL